MKRLLFTLIMGFSFFGLLGQTNKFKTVDVDEFSKFIADTAVTLLDVRTQAEHAEGFIPGTHFNIDVLEDDYTETALRTLPKDKPVALYCRSGNRSKNAAGILAAVFHGILTRDDHMAGVHLPEEILGLHHGEEDVDDLFAVRLGGERL